MACDMNFLQLNDPALKNVFLAEYSIWTRKTKMMKTSRARYTLEFIQEAVHLRENDRSIAAVACILSREGG